MTPLFAELILNPSPMLYFRGDATYDVYGGGLQSVTTNLGVVRPHVARLHRDHVQQARRT